MLLLTLRSNNTHDNCDRQIEEKGVLLELCNSAGIEENKRQGKRKETGTDCGGSRRNKVVGKGEERGGEEYRNVQEQDKKRPMKGKRKRRTSKCSFCVYRAYVTKWDTYVCCISSLWQPLTYFFLCVLPYNSGANITTYGRKSNRRAAGNGVTWKTKYRDQKENGMGNMKSDEEREGKYAAGIPTYNKYKLWVR